MSISKLWATIQAKWNIIDIPIEDHLRDTNQEHLPQTKLLVDAVNKLEDNLTEAYLRGSFAYGDADVHSDIDLFVVVPPEKLAQTYQQFVDFLNEDYSVLVFCHDRLVKDYGGIGFMFIVKDENDKLFQFDFYMAMTGVPPKVPLRNHPRIYTENPEYCWLEENKAKPLPKSAQKFIEHYTANDNAEKKDINAELEYQLVDLLVALNIFQKHVTRCQYGRALTDNNHVLSTCVEMLRALAKDDSPHTSLYTVDKLIKTCKEDGLFADKANRLNDLLLAKPSNQKVIDIFDLGISIIKDHCPEVYTKLRSSIDEYERLVINPLRNAEGRNNNPQFGYGLR